MSTRSAMVKAAMEANDENTRDAAASLSAWSSIVFLARTCARMSSLFMLSVLVGQGEVSAAALELVYGFHNNRINGVDYLKIAVHANDVAGNEGFDLINNQRG